jgi:hypothetical protein
MKAEHWVMAFKVAAVLPRNKQEATAILDEFDKIIKTEWPPSRRVEIMAARVTGYRWFIEPDGDLSLWVEKDDDD